MALNIVDDFAIEGEEKKVAPMSSEKAQVSEADKLELQKTLERKRKEREASEKKVIFVSLVERLKFLGVWDQLTDEQRDFLNGKAAASIVGGTQSALFKVFGDSPAVGSYVTLGDVFKKTLKGKKEMDRLVKDLKAKGVIIEYAENAADIFESTYTITAMRPMNVAG